MSDFCIVCIHGLNGSPHWNFFPTLKKLFKKNGIDFVMPQLSSGFLNSFPKADTWIQEIDAAISEVKKPVVFLGFSLGARAILLYMEKQKYHARHVFIIASPANTKAMAGIKRGRAASFFTHIIDTRTLHDLSDGWTVIHSRDDHIAEFSWGESLAKELHAEFIGVDGYKHFAKRKYGTFLFHVIEHSLALEK